VTRDDAEGALWLFLIWLAVVVLLCWMLSNS
jgi:hypothetical protein